MKYMGSKARLAKHLKPILESYLKDDTYYVEPFAGGCNLICEIDHHYRIANDFNVPLIQCFKDLQNGWLPPQQISRGVYNKYRTYYNDGSCPEDELGMMGYVGINGSYGGRWFDGGYAGITTTKQGKTRNYPEEAYRNVVIQSPKLSGIVFESVDYKDLHIPQNSVVYCDIPYKGTKDYNTTKNSGFNYEEFYSWCKVLTERFGCTVFLSEYEAPVGFELVWEKELTSSLRANSTVSGAKKSVEKLFKYKRS
ncbi:D12 class N6 adenine-specific DNA methyltransferase [Vibrio phage 1.161.O._10N.261.48.C5]|nr:D12 class N6 adenine-specific DNA methyltransferase [Vibrio phage 1.161.O._10N.261.48.C5]